MSEVKKGFIRLEFSKLGKENTKEMYHIVICDDEKEILNKISDKISVEFEKVGLKAQYSLLSDSKELVSLIEKEPIDIFF